MGLRSGHVGGYDRHLVADAVCDSRRATQEISERSGMGFRGCRDYNEDHRNVLDCVVLDPKFHE